MKVYINVYQRDDTGEIRAHLAVGYLEQSSTDTEQGYTFFHRDFGPLQLEVVVEEEPNATKRVQ